MKDEENNSRYSPLSAKGVNFHHKWLRKRELGLKNARGTMDRVLNEMYSSVRPLYQWDSNSFPEQANPGGIFNLEYSPDGSLLVAACEKKNVLLFDANSQKFIQSVENAHDDCVNCVRFLDARMFATCSDDSTIALWDTRLLKSKIRVLYGHSNWVKNVEYSRFDKLLVTSGFDGSIFTWDINSYTERGLLYKKVFHTNGLMRMKLHPEANKMVICTTSGYLIVIHDLDFETLATDLYGFKPNMYRLMQVSDTTIPVAAKYTHLFDPKRKRNRLELLSDFPRGDEAEVISSLQIHPEAWCVLSRNITADERSEWTCVHDIQDCPIDDNQGTDYSESLDETTDRDLVQAQSSSSSRVPEESAADIWETLLPFRDSRDRSQIFGLPLSSGVPHGVRIVRIASGIGDQSSYDEEIDRARDRGSLMESITNDFPVIPSPSVSAEDSRLNHSEDVESIVSSTSASSSTVGSSSVLASDHHPSNNRGERRTVIIIHPNPTTALQRIVRNKYFNQLSSEDRHRIHRNKSRLTHYIEETNAGKGYIKELGFSNDGRVICSPFSFGIRLLAFNDKCSELSSCFPCSTKTPVILHEIGTCSAHTDFVLCTKFSPKHSTLVSGCLSGNIVWYQPYL